MGFDPRRKRLLDEVRLPLRSSKKVSECRFDLGQFPFDREICVVGDGFGGRRIGFQDVDFGPERVSPHPYASDRTICLFTSILLQGVGRVVERRQRRIDFIDLLFRPCQIFVSAVVFRHDFGPLAIAPPGQFQLRPQRAS
ncbi:MAG: hypothetical protein C3F11_06100 [Methylocystaceae bacterium]|nr:MAG: hypothetical protein C3F11_06100 [Methylocystaceae bacterium]